MQNHYGKNIFRLRENGNLQSLRGFVLEKYFYVFVNDLFNAIRIICKCTLKSCLEEIVCRVTVVVINSYL